MLQLKTTPRYSKTSSMSIPARTLLGSSKPVQRIADVIDLTLTDHTYLPKDVSPRHDWVMSVARPAFEALQVKLQKSGDFVRDFCTIGTGAGTDGLVAIEIFAPEKVIVTDLHRDVVDYALANISNNLLEPEAIELAGFVGDLARPLAQAKARFEVIYENLPNIPLVDGIDLFEGQNSASFIQLSDVSPPARVSNALLELHYAFLLQARQVLKPNGRVLSSIGARCPLDDILQMPKSAGFSTRLLIYTWKLQSEVQDVVGGYRTFEEKGRGPFHFYPGEVLARTFEGLSPAEAAENGLEIERQLQEAEVSPAEAMVRATSGEPIGHTVAVIESTPHLTAV